MAHDPARRWQRLAIGLVLLELLMSWLDLRLGPFARVHWEERFNARSGVQFACGHFSEAFELQYRTFCGGCTAEGLLAVPLYKAFGATQLTWKIVPEAFHAGIVALGTWLAGRAGGGWGTAAGGRAGVAFAVLMLAAPGYYRELFHTGWGNHAESTLLPFAAAALVVLAAGRGRIVTAVLFFVAGALLGLGFWFAHTSAHLVGAVILGALAVRWWLSPALALGVPLGAWPWWIYHRERPLASEYAEDWLSRISVSPPDAWAGWLWGEDLRRGLWEVADYGETGMLADVWWFILWGLGIVGSVMAVRWFRSADGSTRAALLIGPVGLVMLLVVYALRYDLWSNLPDPYVNAAFNLRYRAPLWPMLVLCAAPLLALGGRRAVPGLVLAGCLVAYGLGHRLSLWEEWRVRYAELRIYNHDGWVDRTVPPGDPPQTLKRAQGRPVDVRAALTYLEAHGDPLPECRWSHVFELGRRLGLGLGMDPGRGDLAGALDEALELTAVDPLERRYLAFGVAKALVPKGQVDRADLADLLDAIAVSGFDLDVGREAGLLAWEGLHAEDDAATRTWVDPRVWDGVCEGRGRHRVGARTRGGALRPGPREATLIPDDGACEGGAAYQRGVGYGWAERVGCRPEDARLLVEELDGDTGARWVGYQAGCLEHRGQPAPERP